MEMGKKGNRRMHIKREIGVSNISLSHAHTYIISKNRLNSFQKNFKQ